MSEPSAPALREGEWTDGWRIVLACAIANGTGVSLMFYTFSMFLVPMSADFGMTRSEAGRVQAMVVAGAFGAPIFGWLTDRLGFRSVFVMCSLVLVCIGVAQGTVIGNAWWLGVSVALAAFVSPGNSSVTLTRAVNAHFRGNRGLALGLVGIGSSITAILVPPVLHAIIETYGWRGGFLTLAGIGLLIGIPVPLLLMPRSAATARVRDGLSFSLTDLAFMRARDFWLLVIAASLINIAIGGAISQMAPMIQAEGVTAAAAALAISAFAAGQFIGKLGGGWLLDRFEPRRLSAAMILVPALGFAMLLFGGGQVGLAILAAGLIGIVQGADVDIFAYLIARRFGHERYGAIFGSLNALGWAGTVLGILLFSSSYDRLGGYEPVQALSLGLLAIGSAMLLLLSPGQARREN